MNFSGYNDRRIPDWNEMVTSLRTSGHSQAFGNMCSMFDDGNIAQLDALGLMNDVAGADWEVADPSTPMACDQEGETTMPSAEWVDVLGLNKEVDEDDMSEDFAFYWLAMLGEEDPPSRLDYIVYLNDVRGLDLPSIANEIETLRWNNG